MDKDDKIGNRIQNGFTQYKDTQGFNLNGNAVSSDYLKHAIFSKGASLIKLVNKQKSSPDQIVQKREESGSKTQVTNLSISCKEKTL